MFLQARSLEFSDCWWYLYLNDRYAPFAEVKLDTSK